MLVSLQVVGLLGLAAFGLGAPTCQPPARLTVNQAAAYTRSGASPAVFARQVLTAGQTGLALTYAKTRGANVCRFAPNGNLVARMESGFARGGTMYGHVFLTYAHDDYSYRELRSIKRHETRHTTQWAAGTLLGGPLAFPVAYSADELVAPGAYNHFERAAGLTDGGYEVPDGPLRLSPACSSPRCWSVWCCSSGTASAASSYCSALICFIVERPGPVGRCRGGTPGRSRLRRGSGSANLRWSRSCTFASGPASISYSTHPSP